MGGYGSGRHWGRQAKQATEVLPRLDIRWINQNIDIAHKHCRYSYRCGIHIRLSTFKGRFLVVYGDQYNFQKIEWTTTPCNYGGMRYWLTCPLCHGKKGILYLYYGGWGCRQCHNLTYACQQEQPWDRLARQADKIRDRLGWEQGCLNGRGYKPKGMHRSTYTRLCFEHDDYVLRSMQAIYGRFV